MGRRARKAAPDRAAQDSSLLEQWRREWRNISRGEAIFLALVAVGIVALAATAPGGPAGGVVSALALGIAAGVAIAINRARTARKS